MSSFDNSMSHHTRIPTVIARSAARITPASSCVACEGLSAALPAAQVEEQRKLLIPLWQTNTEGTKLMRSYRFRNFRGALGWVNQVGEVAESEGHHPDMRLHSWNRVEIELWTHKVGGITENDLILAVKIDALSEAKV